MTRSMVSALFLILVFAAGVCAQEGEEVIRIKSDLVSFEVSARDSTGSPIKGLTAQDFIVYEDGRRQQVSHIASIETPFNLVLVIDTSLSTQRDFNLMREAAYNFIKQIGPQDRIALVQFSRDVELLADFTSDKTRLEKALDRLGIYETDKTGSSVYDALSLTVGRELLSRREGRKAALILTDGVDSSSMLDYIKIKDSIERSGAGFYFIELDTEKFTEAGIIRDRSDPERLQFSQKQLEKYFKEYRPNAPPARYLNHWLLTPDERREVNKGLYSLARSEIRSIAERTGGRVFSVKRLQDLEGQYQAVVEELHTLYSIGYYPNPADADGKWHEIRVELKQRGAKARHRSGYWR